jgi:hypothetical protein
MITAENVPFAELAKGVVNAKHPIVVFTPSPVEAEKYVVLKTNQACMRGGWMLNDCPKKLQKAKKEQDENDVRTAQGSSTPRR